MLPCPPPRGKNRWLFYRIFNFRLVAASAWVFEVPLGSIRRESITALSYTVRKL